MNITKESEKVLYYLYKAYLERRKLGMSRADAKAFDSSFFYQDKHLSKVNSADIDDILSELHSKKYISLNILGTATLENQTIIDMENRFNDGVKGVFAALESLASFLPW